MAIHAVGNKKEVDMKKLVKKLSYVFSAVLAWALTSPLAHALTYGPQQTVPLPQRDITLGTLETIISTVKTFLMTFGVAVAAIFIIWGGISYMFAGGNSEKATTAKTRLFNGIIGAIVVIGVWVILQTISSLLAGTSGLG